jgi:4-diphosphocytidyl-2-C-methyl-D-erythritol kinase
MILFPPAKINLGLHVLDRREDGLHNIETCLYEIPITDILEILPARESSFVTSGIDLPCGIEDNIVYRAYQILQKDFNLPGVYCHLRKNVPMGAGLGGGSSDAASMLKGLNELFDLGLGVQKLKSLAAELGSDCPFFIEGGAQMATGVGDELTPIYLDLSGKFLKLINNDVHVSTKEAYQNVDREMESLSQELLTSSDLSRWKSDLKNSFERSVFNSHIELSRIKDAMYENGAIYAAMSGSGSTIFGIYDDKPTLVGGFEYEKDISL